MYDFSGIYYGFIRTVIIFGVVAIIFLVESRFGLNPEKRKEWIVGVICIFLLVGTIGYHLFIIHSGNISVHEGEFVKENRSSVYLTEREYCFTNGTELKPVFCLDIFSKKRIYPDDFVKGRKYRIYYTEIGDVIVKVEELE